MIVVGCGGASNATEDMVGEEGEIDEDDEEGKELIKDEEGRKDEGEDRSFDKAAAVVEGNEGAAATLDMVGGMGAGRREQGGGAAYKWTDVDGCSTK